LSQLCPHEVPPLVQGAHGVNIELLIKDVQTSLTIIITWRQHGEATHPSGA
jgi:hypothetical protein